MKYQDLQKVVVKSSQSALGRLMLIASLSVAVLSAGCASAPQAPTDAIQAAEIAIGKAEQARVTEYAAIDLQSARDKLAAAREAVTAKHMVEARRLAEQSRVDADAATAKTEAAKAKLVNTEMQRSNDALRQEIQRKNGG